VLGILTKFLGLGENVRKKKLQLDVLEAAIMEYLIEIAKKNRERERERKKINSERRKRYKGADFGVVEVGGGKLVIDFGTGKILKEF
jgi:hypothetical protein